MSIETVFQAFPHIETEHLTLRRMGRGDAPALFAILSDSEVTRHYDDDTFTALAQADDQIEAWENGYRSRRCIRWGISRRGEETIIGTCGYYGFHGWHLRAGIGYELARSAWRRGIMTEALNAILQYGFMQIGLNRIEAVVLPQNLASLRLLEKIGFHNEGLLLAYENWGNKGFVDLCMLSLRKRQWVEPAAAIQVSYH